MAGKWLWHELNTPDIHRAQTFYSHLFGWGVNEMPMSNGMYFLWQKDGEGHGGMVQTGGPGLENEPTRWLVYIDTDDIERDHARITDLGGKALTHVMDVPGTGRWFLAEDPSGAQFAIMEPAPMPAPAKAAKPKAKAKPAAKGKAAKPSPKPAKPAKAVKPLAKASAKAKPMKAAIKAAKKSVGLKAGIKAKRDLAASKARDASLTGRSQRNNKR